MTNYSIIPFGEHAVLINFDAEINKQLHLHIKVLYQTLQTKAKEGIVSLIPAYDSLTVIFHPKMTEIEKVIKLIEHELINLKPLQETQKTVHHIPVCYSMGLDIGLVKTELNLSISELVDLHCKKDYLIYFLGFVPGFMYLGDLNKKLHIPRKQEPRLKIPAGSVALGGSQTGIYPLETPGGWQIIGQCPSVLYGSDTSINMGDYIRFYEIDETEYKSLSLTPIKPKTTVE